MGDVAARGEHDAAALTSSRLATADGYRAAVLADDPVAFWALDESTGTVAADSTGNGLSATYGAGYSHSTTVAPIGADDVRSFGSGSSSNGVTASLPASALNVGTSGTYDTVELWMRWTGGTSGQGIFDFDSTTYAYALWILPSTIGFISGYGEIYGASTTGLADGWHLVDAEFDNGNESLCKLYIDGVPQTLTLSGGSNHTQSIASSGGNVPIKFGGWRYSSGYSFSGQIDEVSVFKGALTGDQINAHWAGVNGGSGGSAPVNTVLPSLSGTFAAGSAVTTSNGTWQNGVDSFAYQWRRCDAAGANCADIAGATAQSYSIQGPDVGSTLRAVVTATNSSGSTSATSTASAMVTATAPELVSPPALSGFVDIGETLVTNEGRWTSGLEYTNTVQWQRCNPDGTGCADISGASGDSYSVTSDDLGKGIRVEVTSSNSAGATVAYSALASNGDYWSAVKASAPVAWYHFDETSGATAADSAGSSHVHNAGYPSGFDGYAKEGAPDGHPDDAVASEAGLGAITVPYSPDLNSDQFSVEAWVRPTGAGAGDPTPQAPIVTAVGCTGYQLSLITLSDGAGPSVFALSIPHGGTGDAAVSGLKIEMGQWYLVTGTYDGTTARLYVDGSEVASKVVAYTPNTTADMQIGRCVDFNSELRPFDGSIDEVSIYDHAMSAAEVQTHATYVGEGLGQTYGDGELAEDASDRWPGNVNAASGNFFTSATDASMPGIGLPFQFTRNYNSADTASGPFGTGWTFSYGARLQIADSGDVTAIAGDGQQLFFAKEPDGSFLAANGGRATLTPLAGGGYEMVTTDQLHYAFNTQGRLTSLLDRNGQGSTFGYDTYGNLSNIHQTAGRDIAVATDASGHITGITLPDNRQVGYGYTNGLLTTVTDLRGGTITYSYDASNRLRSIVDQNGNAQVTNTYGSDGRVSGQTDALDHTRGYEWDPATETSTFTDERGHTETDVFTDNVLVSHTDQLGHLTRYTYGQSLTGRSTTDPRGNVTLTDYDANGNLLSRTMPDGTHESWTYDSLNDVLTHTDARGYVTSYGYDTHGNRTSEIDPGDAETDYAYDPTGTGLLVSTTDARQKTTSYAYDSAGNMLSTTSPLGEATTMTYDSTGRLLSRVDPRGNVTGADPDDYRTTFAYDDGDDLLSTTDPLGDVTSSTYDAVGNKTSMTDARNKTTSWAYDDDNELTTVTAPDSSQTSYTYDASGNELSKTDANDHQTSYGYDAADQQTSMTTPLGEAWGYGYDADGNRVGVTAPAGEGSVVYSYDALNRLSGVDYSDSTPDVSYGYDADGDRVSMSDGGGSVSYSYDGRDRVTQVGRGSSVFGYAYDAVSHVTERDYPDGRTIAYGYDDDGRLSSVTSGGVTSTYSYDAAGNETALVFPSGNGYSETRTYDRAGRVSEVKDADGSSTLSQFDYVYDGDGDATRITTLEGEQNYSYDDLGRITAVCYQASPCGASDAQISYAYDPVGNRSSEQTETGSISYSYNADDELTSQTGPDGTTGYGYDARGNETQEGSRTFAFDLSGRMVSTSDAGATTSYTYDGDGNRLTASDATTTTSYAWDSNWQLPELASESQGGSELRGYVYGNRLLSMVEGGGSYYFHADRLGSIAAVTDAAGQPELKHSYDPFGNLRSSWAAAGAPTVTVGYVGQLADAGTGLYDMRARMYDPGLGRFTATDPLAAAATAPAIEAYDYAGQDPINGYDLTGLYEESGEIIEGGPAGDEGGSGESETQAIRSQALKGALTKEEDETYESLVSRRNDMHHIFENPTHDHQLGPLVKALGGENQVARQVVMNLGHLDMASEGVADDGVFGVSRTVSGVTMKITGRIINGTIRISDFYVPW